MPRTIAIDLLRGFIMILMAIDHASAMIARVHFTEIWGLPFKGYESLGWWFTRFVSHLCAPGFFFLMGMSICLFSEKRRQSKSNWQDSQIRNYFLKRGGLILLFMFFLELPAWILSEVFNRIHETSETIALPGFYEGGFLIPTTVLYGLGACMILSAFLWKLRKEWFLLITVLSFALSAWYVMPLSPEMVLNPIEVLLIVPGLSVGAMSLYPVIPWLGITTFGMFWAKLLLQQKERIYPISFFTGCAFIGLFFILRFLEISNYQHNDYHNWISFFTLIKYPPSLVFALLTCGINLILLFVFAKLGKLSPTKSLSNAWLQPIKLFGQTAMFFYIVHLYLYALIGVFFPYGCSIWLMYLLWAMGLFLLYFVCRWFLAFKSNKPVGSFWKMV